MITILGAGVSGLTTGITLLEAGYRVQILTKDLPKDTVSAVAGAIWFPYEARPFEKVSSLSMKSFHTYKELSEDTESGISMIDYAIILEEPDTPWWLESIPGDHIISDSVSGYYEKDYPGYIVHVPLIETPVYLPFLVNRFQSLGGSVAQQEITSTKELNDLGLVINCTGLGSESLFGDQELYPILGQVVKVEPDPGIKGMATDFHFGENNEEMAYIIPRRDGIILGGIAKPHNSSTAPDQELSNKLISYNAEYDPRLSNFNIIETKAGLRPGRSEIRLEKDPDLNVIHNYGHGGAGYTVSWGCAASVLELVNSELS